ncbi:MAG: transposase [Elusimicrobia bacterium]|nr:transposase [Elusimicrobiota bacterium]
MGLEARGLIVLPGRLRGGIGQRPVQASERQRLLPLANLAQQQRLSCYDGLADGGYTGEPFRRAVKAAIGAGVEIAKRNELRAFAVIPKRWVVERSFSWIEKRRRLWKNFERLVASSLAMVQQAFIRILLKRL